MSERQESDRARRYAGEKLALSLMDTALSLSLVLLLVVTPLSRTIAEWTANVTEAGTIQWLLYAAVVGGAFALVGLLSGFISEYKIEHRYGLSAQNFAGWLTTRLKGFLLGIALGIPLLLGFRALLLYTGQWWGLAAGITTFLFSILLARLAPTLLFPIFFRFEPINDASLEEDLREICERGGLKLEGVYRFDMSKATKKANAAFAGLGSTKRIILGDTLLESFPREEIRAVVAHEVGHYRHRHIQAGILVSGALLIVLFVAAQLAYQAVAPVLGYGPAGDLAGLPLIMLFLGVAGFIFQPLVNTLSRRFERQADRYAFTEVGPEPMADALRRLADQNLAERQPNPLVEALFHSHPSIEKRLAAAEAWGTPGNRDGFRDG
jgi:STE24 endopeptidase